MKKLFENPEISLFELTSEDVVMLSAESTLGTSRSFSTTVTLDDTADYWKGKDAWI